MQRNVPELYERTGASGQVDGLENQQDVVEFKKKLWMLLKPRRSECSVNTESSGPIGLVR